MRNNLLTAIIATVFMAISFGSASAETLNLLTWKDYAPKVLRDKFQQETGIEVKNTFSNNEEMIAKLRATRGAGFDLAQPSQDRISSVQAKFNIYQALDFSKIKSELFITSMLEAVKNNTMVDGKPHAVPFCWGSSGLIVNRKLAPNASDYSDLLNAMYAGRISYRLKRPTLIGVAFAMGEDPFAKYGDAGAYKSLMDRVENSLVAGKGLVKNYWTNGDNLLQLLRSGEVEVAMGWDGGGWKLHAENPDIDFVAPKSGALGWIDTFAIPAKAKNVSGAYKWINFIMRPENAAIFTNQEKYATASKGAADLTNADIKANFNRSFPPAVIDNIKWYPPVPANLETIESKLLDRVKATQ
ncbi:MAG: extracellular solute-binding protein [SAR324 cluster bacterium]|nr:extracellular solute-binding protein [SAR324 cluster bacterium]